jgi:hypothetical protein
MTVLSNPAPADALAEKRAALRHPASLVPAITGVHLSPFGGPASLVNISTSGALVNCNTKLVPGTKTTVIFDGTFTPSSIVGTVVRCTVSHINAGGSLSYEIGIAFDQEVTINEDREETPSSPTTQPPIVPSKLVNRW